MKKKVTKDGKRLKDCENIRKDGIYQYRYRDASGKYKYLYSKSLSALRIKESRIESELIAGINPMDADMTVMQLLEKYISIKDGVRYNTKVGYQFVMNVMEKEGFSERKIRDIKVSDAKAWLVKLQNDGRGYSSITSIRGVIKPAFQMAFEDDLIVRNPFAFQLKGVIRNTTRERKPLSLEEKKMWLDFMRTDSTYSKYYDDMVILLETGMRVSEFCGLTVSDVDFENNCIYLNKQLLRTRNGVLFVEETKTSCGRRKVPMSPAVREAFSRLITKRKKLGKGVSVDGFKNFILFDKNAKPKVALHVENEMRWGLKKFKKLYPEMEYLEVTPHILRHTFATNNILYGKMGIKGAQLVMGHSEAHVTMDVYTGSDYSQAAKEIVSVSNLFDESSKEF